MMQGTPSDGALVDVQDLNELSIDDPTPTLSDEASLLRSLEATVQATKSADALAQDNAQSPAPVVESNPPLDAPPLTSSSTPPAVNVVGGAEQHPLGENNVYAEDDEDDEAREKANSVEQVLQMDSIMNGVNNAMEFFSWGATKATEAVETLAQSEPVKEVVEKMQPSFQKLKENAGQCTSAIRTESSRIVEQAKPGLEQFGESASASLASVKESLSGVIDESKPTFQEFSSSAAQGFTKIRESANTFFDGEATASGSQFDAANPKSEFGSSNSNTGEGSETEV